MRKTRFFYGKIMMLSMGLAWAGLFLKAADLEKEKRREYLQRLERLERQVQNTEQTIRVLIMDSDQESYIHPSVTARVNGEEYTYTRDTLLSSTAPVILEGGAGGVTVLSVSRQQGNPVYQGRLELHLSEEGIYMINEVPLEIYLESVVPSEMPSTYEIEALKAQAVCARTYAVKQMEGEKLKEYGADVDDSVNDQVYGNVVPQETTSRAVTETRGQVLTHEGELIEAYYFSTSPGMTSTDEVWGAKEAASYLHSVPCDFDVEEPYGEWRVSLDWETLAKRANEKVGGSGGLTGLEVVNKSQSGAVTGLRILTENGEALLSDEYEVREFLSPAGKRIRGKNDAKMEGGALLPSAYFTLEQRPGKKVKLMGRGYGHGVGMSQNGANEMARQGYTCEEILEYFFKDVEIVRR